MIKGVNVNIVLRDNQTGAYLLIPVVPPAIQYTDGPAQADSVKIINLGNVNYPNGVDLDTIGWTSFFPARYDAAYVTTSQLLRPTAYRDRLSSWKDNGTALQLVCPAAGINKEVYLDSFTWDFSGFEGDIAYTVSFKEIKTVRPKKLTPSGTVPPKGKKSKEDRNAAPEQATPKTYTVKSGDTLSRIAKAQGIRSWRTIYEKNRGKIKNPNVISVGQVLKL